MSSTASISIDRTSLSLSALVIDDSTSAYRLTPNGLGDPAMTWRLGSMPDSPSVHGTEYTSAALEQTALPLEVIIMGANAAAVRTAKNALTAAISQFSYEVTVTVDGVADVWTCGPGSWSTSGGAIRYEMAAAALQILTINIPVYPVPS